MIKLLDSLLVGQQIVSVTVFPARIVDMNNFHFPACCPRNKSVKISYSGSQVKILICAPNIFCFNIEQ